MYNYTTQILIETNILESVIQLIENKLDIHLTNNNIYFSPYQNLNII